MLALLEASLSVLARVATGAVLHGALCREAGVDLSHELSRLLYLIGEHGPIRPTDLAVVAGVSQPTASRQAAHLIAGGYVAKVTDPDDMRAVLLETTEQGSSAVLALRREYRRLADRALASWPREDIVTLGVLADRYANSVHALIRERATRDRFN